MENRSDTLPRLIAGVLAGSLAGGIGVQRMRRRRVGLGSGRERFLDADSGNLISYQLHPAVAPAFSQDPLLVFVPDLGATVERWSELRMALEHDFSVLTHNRAGYGRSRYRMGGEFSLGSAVSDLLSVIEKAGSDRPVVLMGHGLGGLIALLAEESLPTASLMLLDPRYPAELQRSVLLRSKSEQSGFNLKYMPSSSRIGLSSLLVPPPWAGSLPADVRRLCLDQYRDAELWRAYMREWKAAHSELQNPDPMPVVRKPLHLVTSNTKGVESEAYEEMHAELLKSADAGRRTSLENVMRDQLPMGSRCVESLVPLVGEFLQSICGPGRTS
ncbi:alpha/beta fold hydrolase [Streptomyces sp. CLV115]|uniref:alpha/beta hydrolase n=1 Tax=Streptomyces sp. CLV115 TaxID=3138502 RepID=UPI00313DA36E